MDKRKLKALTQRLYLISETENKGDTVYGDYISYAIQGTTGNVYDVLFGDKVSQDKWSCTCPDHRARKSVCKHIHFVRARILACSSDERSWVAHARFLDRQAALTKSRPFLASQEVISEYTKKRKPGVERRLYLEEDCPICYDHMSSEEGTAWCRYSCGNSMHTECLNKWTARVGRNCPYCRASLDDIKRPKLDDENDYINVCTANDKPVPQGGQ